MLEQIKAKFMEQHIVLRVIIVMFVVVGVGTALTVVSKLFGG